MISQEFNIYITEPALTQIKRISDQIFAQLSKIMLTHFPACNFCTTLSLESVGKFGFLGDMLNSDSGADSVVVVRARCAWKMFRE